MQGYRTGIIWFCIANKLFMVWIFLIPFCFANSELLDFLDDIRKWIEEDPKHVVLIHCKGGKGKWACKMEIVK